MVLCKVADDLTQNISNNIEQLYFMFLRMNSFETILMILYYLVPMETSPKLDIFEIQYYTIGWIVERDFVLELRVAWGLKNWVLVPVNPFRNIFVFGLG
jgi:hypothetical protein